MSTTTKYIIFIGFILLALASSFYFLLTTLPVQNVGQHILMEILAGFFVSFTFILLALRFYRPKFLISPYICFREGRYYFKVVNKSIYHAFDVSFEIYLMEPYIQTEAFPSVVITPIRLTTDKITTINRYRSKRTTSDPFCLYAITISTPFNIEERIKGKGVFLELRLTAKHGLTGLADRFVKKFNKNSIKHNHKFEYARKLDTMDMNQN